jgi:hypothetical protein
LSSKKCGRHYLAEEVVVKEEEAWQTAAEDGITNQQS